MLFIRDGSSELGCRLTSLIIDIYRKIALNLHLDKSHLTNLRKCEIKYFYVPQIEC